LLQPFQQPRRKGDELAVRILQSYRALTHVLVHASLPHLIFNMYSFSGVGERLERLVGSVGLLQVYCNTLHHTAPYCNTLRHTATHCNTLQHTAPCCNTPQHLQTMQQSSVCTALHHTATYCHILQHTATHCNTLQHTATPADDAASISLEAEKGRKRIAFEGEFESKEGVGH